MEAIRARTAAKLSATRWTRSLAEEAGKVVIATDVEEVVIGGAGEDVAPRAFGHRGLGRRER